jgi:hypothetical protein
MIVRIIRSTPAVVLVEWFEEGEKGKRDAPRRGWIPSTAISANQEVDEKQLKKSVPYGLPYEKVLPSITITPEMLGNALRINGVWTAEDVLKNPMSISRALVDCMGLHTTQIQSLVREFTSKS